MANIGNTANLYLFNQAREMNSITSLSTHYSKYLILFLGLNTFYFVHSQNNAHLKTAAERNSSAFEINKNVAPTITLIPIDQTETKKTDQKKKRAKTKKKNKRVYFDIRLKPRYLKKKTRKTKTEILFFIAKGRTEAPPFRRQIYYYNRAKKRISKSNNRNHHKHSHLHGHYIKKINGRVVEEGYYYKGVKHGRWEKHSRRGILIDRKIYNKGFAKDSKITYYNDNSAKIKEVVPYHYGEKEGLYLRYYESGRLAEMGLYRGNYKVGNWYEYYDRKRYKSKSIIKYPKKPYYDDDVKGLVVKAWNEKGKRIHQK